ncbi:hypothetical protein CHARACLAT_002458 [Characodon lateralis]|uniref:Uncharacterized protein n=1 Tax=Characodon lateralis TaxID=208331 RepID=A0ABU7DQV9_9TELE|nr:hypothetical protein [Characodon lateralis]
MTFITNHLYLTKILLQEFLFRSDWSETSPSLKSKRTFFPPRLQFFSVPFAGWLHPSLVPLVDLLGEVEEDGVRKALSVLSDEFLQPLVALLFIRVIQRRHL